MTSEYATTFEAWQAILDSDRDVTLVYQGGSGGFFAYYLLLLTGQFEAGVHLPIEECIDRQFPEELMSDTAKWKQYEIWPYNHDLKNKDTTKRKLFLICNPLFNSDCYEDNKQIASDTMVVMVTTPLRTQLRLAWDKRAYWFTLVSRQHFHAPTSDKKYMKWILRSVEKGYDPMIPAVKMLFGVEHELDLASLMQLECLNDDQRSFVNRWFRCQSPKSQLRLNPIGCIEKYNRKKL